MRDPRIITFLRDFRAWCGRRNIPTGSELYSLEDRAGHLTEVLRNTCPKCGGDNIFDQDGHGECGDCRFTWEIGTR